MLIITKKSQYGSIIISGAGTGTQTRGLFLGKEALYQLSYTRVKWWRDSESNRGHEALQATALPTELSRRAVAACQQVQR